MYRSELRHPSMATALAGIAALLSLAALIVSLSSSASALSSRALVRKGDIAPGAVSAKSLARGAIHPKALAKGAVNSKALADGAVNASKLAKASVTADAVARGAVTSAALAHDSVTAEAIAPGSVYGGALGPQTIHATPIADLDAVASNPEWTASNSENAVCGPGERLLSSGFGFSNPGNREVSFLQVRPFISATTNGVSGRISSNSGGSAVGEVQAVCLK